MIKYVRAAEDSGTEPVLFQTVIDESAPPGKDPTVIAFALLKAPSSKTTNLMTGKGDLVEFGTEKCVVRAFALESCASVCFVNRKQPGNPKGYVYHANTGTISEQKFKEIMKEIEAGEAPYKHVDVIFAHRNGTDDGYKKDLGKLDGWLGGGLVVEVTHLPETNSFGMDQSVHAGL